MSSHNGHFQWIFWSFGVSMRSFIGFLHPVIGIDACHFTGILMMTMGVDGLNKLFPTAFSIVEIESGGLFGNGS